MHEWKFLNWPKKSVGKHDLNCVRKTLTIYFLINKEFSKASPKFFTQLESVITKIPRFKEGTNANVRWATILFNIYYVLHYLL